MDVMLRLAELLAAVSLATDLADDAPFGNALGDAVAVVAFAQVAGLSAEDVSDAYYLALLYHVGCTDGRARLLLPRGPEERHGRDEITNRIKGWFASASLFEVLSTSNEAIGGRHRLSWRLRVVRDSGVHELVEQIAFVDLGPDGIQGLDLLCSGFQPEAEPSSGCDLSVQVRF